MKEHLVIATRGSKLALWQANHIAALLKKKWYGLSVELLVLTTTGDRILDAPLAKIGGKGLFTKEIEEALLDRRADLAVHSMKDVPTEQPEGLIVDVVPEREAPTDCFLSVEHDSVASLPKGATVGTSSLRRQAQLLRMRPDLDIKLLRGNLDTRVRKLIDGEYAAIVVAKAGLNRLEITAPKMAELAPPAFWPACAQGALGIERRIDDLETAEALDFLNHAPSKTAVAAERAFLGGLDGGCQVPIAGHAKLLDDATLEITGLVCDVDGTKLIQRSLSGPAEHAATLGKTLASEVLAAGGKAILDRLYGR